MFILTIYKYRWRIEKDNRPVLSGIGATTQALAIAKAHGYVLSVITYSNEIRRVA